jgi:hypothetical protein
MGMTIAAKILATKSGTARSRWQGRRMEGLQVTRTEFEELDVPR